MTTKGHKSKKTEYCDRVAEALASHGLTLTFRFVPKSAAPQDRIRKEDPNATHWKLELRDSKRVVLDIDYTVGSGYSPSYKIKDRHQKNLCLASEAETGMVAEYPDIQISSPRAFTTNRPIPAPSIANGIYSLLLVADAIDYVDFEDWADDFGCDTDSRKAEALYMECQKIGIELRELLGVSTMDHLRELLSDF